MVTVEVFKTNVVKAAAAKRLIRSLQSQWPGSRITFDLKDCDNVLRVEGFGVKSDSIIELVREAGFCCTPLP